jgi:hypothetical protein
VKRYLLVALLAVVVCRSALGDDGPAPLKPGPGDGEVSANCSGCHTSDYIVMNSMFLTADGWKAEVTKMRSAFGARLDDATAGAIIAYLAAHYAVAAKP